MIRKTTLAATLLSLAFAGGASAQVLIATDPITGADILWSTLAFIVLVSIMLHGATVSPVMRYLDWRQKRGVTQRESAELETAT